MSPKRRSVLKFAGAVMVSATAAMLKIGCAFAATWNKAGFEAKAPGDALRSLGAGAALPSKEITVTAPDIAEDGAQVPITVSTKLAKVQAISIVVDKNPFPLSSTFEFANGADGYVSTRIRMDQTANVTAVVKADGRFFTASKEVRVTIGGCGA